MGKKNRRTAGTVGVNCNCAPFTFVEVLVLEGLEGQRMPIELIVYRVASLRDDIVSALCRGKPQDGLDAAAVRRKAGGHARPPVSLAQELQRQHQGNVP